MVNVLCGNRRFTFKNGRRRSNRFVLTSHRFSDQLLSDGDGGCALWESEFHIFREPSTIYHPLNGWSIRFCSSENFSVSAIVRRCFLGATLSSSSVEIE